MLGRRIAGFTLAVALVLAGAACNAPSSYSPKDHDNHRVKAEGLTTIKIRCHKDVWERTGKEYKIKGKITEGEIDLITVEISGPQLSDLLKELDKDFYEPSGEDDPVARRLYEALTQMLDGIKVMPRAGDPVPEVIVDDLAVSSPSPSAPASPSS